MDLYLTPQERAFLLKQAQRLQSTAQPCKLVTTTQHSIFTGRVIEANEGGLVFQTDLERVTIPWTYVGEIIEPVGAGRQ